LTIFLYPPEDVKKSDFTVLVLGQIGRADFRSFRMRAFKFQINLNADKYMWLTELISQCSNPKGGALKLLQPARPPGLMRGVDFFTPSLCKREAMKKLP